MTQPSFRKISSIRAAITFAGLCLALVSTSLAADKDDDISEVTLVSGDGWPLKLTYFKSTEGKESPVVIMLHGKGDNRLVWGNAKPASTKPAAAATKGAAEPAKGLAFDLHKAGFSVISLDLRKHGQSKPGEGDDDSSKKDDKGKATKKGAGSELKAPDYQAMVLDLAVVKKFIFEEHQKEHLNMRKTAIVAPAMSASLAMIFTAEDWAKKPYNDAATLEASTPRGQDIQSLVLISPEMTVPGLQPHLASPVIKQLPIASLVFVAKDDPQDKDQAKKLFQQIGGEAPQAQPKKAEPKKVEKPAAQEKPKDELKRLEYLELPGKLRGTDLLGNNNKFVVEKLTVRFLTTHLKELKGPRYDWRDRKSKLAD